MGYRTEKGRQSAGKVSVLVALLSAFPAGAADLLEIYQLAVKNDPTTLGAGFEHSAVTETVKEARAGLLPDVSFEYDRTETSQDIVSSDNTVFAEGSTDFPTTNYTLTIRQPLINWAAYLGFKQAQSDKLRSDAEYLGAQQDLMLQTAELYLSALAAEDEVSFARAEHTAVQRQLELALERLITGMGRITDVHDAHARYASVETSVIEAQNAQDDSNQALREIAGDIPGELSRLMDNIDLVQPEPADSSHWVQAAMAQNPRIVLQSHAVEVARKEMERQKAGHYPTVDLAYRINNNETEGTLFGGGSEVETSDLSLRLNIPLYQGGSTSARSKKAAFLYQQSRQELTKTQRAVFRETRAAYLGAISSISRAGASRQYAESQQRALEARQEGFKSGLETVISILDAERDLYSAKRDYAKSRYDYLYNSLRLKHAVGDLQESDMQAINQWFK